MQIKSLKALGKLALAATVLVLAAGQHAYGQDSRGSMDSASLSGRTVLITGSTDGLGREVAMRLGDLGAHVLVHGRSTTRGEEVVAEINAGPGSAEFYQADFADLDNVRKMAAAINKEQPRLDMLINNAGIGSGFGVDERPLSHEGYELHFQVNYLAHYLLTELLLPKLKASAPARIINVASRAQTPIDFNNVMLEQGYDSNRAYRQSKLAMVMHAFYMAGQLEGSGVTFNALHPASMMDTTMVAQMDRPARTSVDEGARALMQLAVSPELAGRSGLYFEGMNEARAVRGKEQAYDAQAWQRLDALSRRLVGLPPR